MRINYVIATFNGKCRRNHTCPTPNDVLRAHLVKLKSCMGALQQVTIMVAKSQNYYHGYYDIEEITAHFDIPVKVIHCDNYGYSMGQWLKAYEMYEGEFDYYILMEDDYCPGMQNFDNLMIDIYGRKFPDSVGLLCSIVLGSEDYAKKRGYPAHFGGGVCVSTRTLERLYSFWLAEYGGAGPRVQLDNMTSKTSPGFNWEREKSMGGGYYQVGFSHLFTMAGIEHKDYLDIGWEDRLLRCPYWHDGDGGVIRLLNKGGGRKSHYDVDEIYRSPIIPVQLANPTFVAHHTPFSLPVIKRAIVRAPEASQFLQSTPEK